LTDALVYSLEFEVAKNLSHKKDSEPDSKFPGDQYQTEDVAVMELIVEKVNKLSHRFNQNLQNKSPVLLC